MQVFVPFQNPFECAQALDPRRFNKQILECKQIIDAIYGRSTAWTNHPCVLMYRQHVDWRKCYLNAFECFKAYKDLAREDMDEAMVCYELAKEWGEKANICTPYFFTENFINQHRRRLHTKDPKHYAVWEDLGTSYENWYFVDGKMRIYISGRTVKTEEL